MSKPPAHRRFKFRTWRRERNLCDFSGLHRLDRIAYLPLAHRKATARPFLEIHVDMVLVVAIRTGAKHRRKALARVPSQPFAEVPCDLRIGQANAPSISQPDRANIKGVRPAMLAQLRSDDVVAAAAMVRCIVVDTAQRCTKRQNGRSDILSHPVHNSLSHAAAKGCRRRERDVAAIRHDNRFKAHRVVHRTLSRAFECLKRRRDGKIGCQSQLACRCVLQGYRWRRTRPWQGHDLRGCLAHRNRENNQWQDCFHASILARTGDVDSRPIVRPGRTGRKARSRTRCAQVPPSSMVPDRPHCASCEQALLREAAGKASQSELNRAGGDVPFIYDRRS